MQRIEKENKEENFKANVRVVEHAANAPTTMPATTMPATTAPAPARCGVGYAMRTQGANAETCTCTSNQTSNEQVTSGVITAKWCTNN